MRKKTRILWKERITALLFLSPLLFVFTVFKYVPFLENFRLSLMKWNLFTKPSFIGFSNFQTIFISRVFWQVLRNTMFFTIVSTIISIVLGFFVAIILYRKRSIAARILKTLFFVPNVTTASAVALLWKWIFDPDSGLSARLFSFFHLQSPRWLLDPKLSMWVVISLAVWRSVGYVMLIYSSGLSGIPDDVYEAAAIDGASPSQAMFHIVLPMLATTTYFLVLTSLIQAMQVFDIVSVMTEGGPFNSTNVMNLYIYQQAFGRNRAGIAAALSVILFLILLGTTTLQRIGTNKEAGK